MRIVRLDRGLDLAQLERAVGAVGDGLRLDRAEHREAAGFIAPLCVTAPRLPGPTSAADFSRTPESDCLGGLGFLFANCAFSTIRLRLAEEASMRMRSPLRTSASSPPQAASGETWPIIMPRVAPEKRPSVRSATFSPMPCP